MKGSNMKRTLFASFPEPTPWNGGPDDWPPEPPHEREEEGEPEMYECDCCGRMVPVEALEMIPAHACSAGIDTCACPKCRGE